MNIAIDFINQSNNNRYTYRFYKDQILVQSHDKPDSCYSCLGGITGNCNPGQFDKAIINLYTNLNRYGNNWLIFSDEECNYYLEYINSLFPIFTWEILPVKDKNEKIIKLVFTFDNTIQNSECRQIKMILNLVRRLYECPRNYQLKHIIELYKQQWHNLSIHQIMLLGELTEYYSTNDHKLISFMVTALPTDKEFVSRTKHVSGIFNGNRISGELDMNPPLINLPSDFSFYPLELNEPLLKQYEYLFSLSNQYRKILKLDEL